MKTIIRVGKAISPTDATTANHLGTLPIQMLANSFAKHKANYEEAVLIVHEAPEGTVYMTVGNSPPEIFVGGRDVWAVFAPPEAQDPVASFMEERHAREWASTNFAEISFKIGRIDSTDKPVVRTSIGLLIYKDGKVLLGRSSRDGSWGMPEGALQMGESIESATRRTAKVSVGLDVGKVSICQRAPYINCFVEQAGQHFLVLVMIGEYIGGEPQAISSTWDKWEWCNADIPPNPLYPTVQAVIDLVKQSLLVTKPSNESVTKQLEEEKAKVSCGPQNPRPRPSARRRKPSRA